MRVLVAVVALVGLLVWEAWAERTRHRIKLLLERLPELLVLVTADLTAWQLAMAKAFEAMAELLLTRYREPAAPSSHVAGNAVEVSGAGYTVIRPGHPPQRLDAADVAWSPLGASVVTWMTWTQAPDDSWVDAYSGQGEELEALDQVIEEQRERIRRIR